MAAHLCIHHPYGTQCDMPFWSSPPFLALGSFKKCLSKAVFSISEDVFFFLVLVLHSFVFGEGICLLPFSEGSSDVSAEAVIRASSDFPICLAALSLLGSPG